MREREVTEWKKKKVRAGEKRGGSQKKTRFLPEAPEEDDRPQGSNTRLGSSDSRSENLTHSSKLRSVHTGAAGLPPPRRSHQLLRSAKLVLLNKTRTRSDPKPGFKAVRSGALDRGGPAPTSRSAVRTTRTKEQRGPAAASSANGYRPKLPVDGKSDGRSPQRR